MLYGNIRPEGKENNQKNQARWPRHIFLPKLSKVAGLDPSIKFEVKAEFIECLDNRGEDVILI